MEEKHEKRLSSWVNTVLSLAGRSNYSLARLVGDMEGINYSSTVKHENESVITIRDRAARRAMYYNITEYRIDLTQSGNYAIG